MTMKLLMHTCCAPCSVYCVDSLRAEGIEPTLFWYNPNIHPYIEYKTRRDCLKDYAKKYIELNQSIKELSLEDYATKAYAQDLFGKMIPLSHEEIIEICNKQ